MKVYKHEEEGGREGPPVCVRMCLLSSEGLSNALPHTSHGSSVLSPRGGRDLGDG